MKLLIDVNNIIYASFFVNININNNEFIHGMVYHLFLNKLLMFKNKFNVKNENIILTFDHKIMWRRKFFQYYKSHRKEAREKTGIDFKQLFEIIDNLYYFLYENCSFITLRHKWLECDDWIGVLSKYYDNEHLVIISTDKDFYQCHSDMIRQYDHIKKKFITINNPKLELLIHILSGEPAIKDAIPNVLSDDDTFVVKGKRQKPLGEKKILKLIREKELKKFINDNKRNFKRNEKLISFNKIPENIKNLILKKIENYEISCDRMKAMAFLHNNKLNQVLNQIDKLVE